MEFKLNSITPEIKEKFENNPIIVMDYMYQDSQIACVFGNGQLIEVIFE